MLEIERRHVMWCMLDAVTKLTVLPDAWNRKTTCYVMYAWCCYKVNSIYYQMLEIERRHVMSCMLPQFYVDIFVKYLRWKKL